MKKTFSLTFLAFFVLTACSSVPPKSPADGAAKQPAAAPVSVNEGEVEVPASRYGTNMKCSMLKSTERQQECEMQINDLVGSLLESEITSSFDAGRCNELSDELAKSCQERLAETGVKGPVSAEELTLFNEIQRGTLSEDPENPKLVYDNARCAELKAGGYKEYCEKQLAEQMERTKFDEILQANEKGRCSELTTEMLKNDCKRFFGEEVAEEVPPRLEVAPATTEGTPVGQ